MSVSCAVCPYVFSCVFFFSCLQNHGDRPPEEERARHDKVLHEFDQSRQRFVLRRDDVYRLELDVVVGALGHEAVVPVRRRRHGTQEVGAEDLKLPRYLGLARLVTNWLFGAVILTDSLTACGTYKIDNGTKKPIRNESGKTEITGRLQLISADLLGPATPAARGNYRFMAKCSDYYIKFKAVYIITA